MTWFVTWRCTGLDIHDFGGYTGWQGFCYGWWFCWNTGFYLLLNTTHPLQYLASIHSMYVLMLKFCRSRQCSLEGLTYWLKYPSQYPPYWCWSFARPDNTQCTDITKKYLTSTKTVPIVLYTLTAVSERYPPYWCWSVAAADSTQCTDWHTDLSIQPVPTILMLKFCRSRQYSLEDARDALGSYTDLSVGFVCSYFPLRIQLQVPPA